MLLELKGLFPVSCVQGELGEEQFSEDSGEEEGEDEDTESDLVNSHDFNKVPCSH